jgi:ATP-binding cassette, subfamily B, bacterial PglK
VKHLSRDERRIWISFTIYRSAMSLIDLASLLFLAILTFSVVKNFTGTFDVNSRFSLAGFTFPLVPPEYMLFGAIAVVSLFLGKSLASLVVYRKLVFFLSNIDARIAKKMAKGVLGTKYKKNFSVSAEELNYAISTGINSAFSSQLNAWSVIAAEMTLFIFILFGFFVLDPQTAFLTSCYFILVALFIGKIVQKRAENRGRKGVRSAIASHTFLSDLFGLHASGLSRKNLNYFLDKIEQSKLEASNSFAMQLYLSSVPRYVVESALAVGVIALAAIQLSSSDFLTSATLLSVFLAGGFRLSAAILPIQAAVISLKSNSAKAESALVLLNQSPTSEETSTETLDSEGQFGVRFNKVTFAYPNAEGPVLRDVSFEVPANERLYIIGKSGSGKTTIAELIAGNVSPTSGSIDFLNKEGKSQDLSSAPEVSYVNQKPILISGTLFENIALSDSPTEENVSRAIDLLKKVRLHDVITELPEGIFSYVGKLRDSFSGGEIQRIALARALYTKPTLLILDEFTSSLDIETEHELLDSIGSDLSRTTLIVITHKLHSIPKHAAVIRLDQGKVVSS